MSDQTPNEFLEKMVDDLEKNPPEDKNGGYAALVKDLEELLMDAVEFEFDDFRNKKYAAPKIELANRLHVLRGNIMSGKYDN